MSPTRGELGRPVSAWRLEWAGRREPPPGSGNGLWSGDMCSFDKCLLWQPHRTVQPAAGRGVWLWVTSEEVPGPLAEAATLQWSGCIGCCVACGQGSLPWDGAPSFPRWSSSASARSFQTDIWGVGCRDARRQQAGTFIQNGSSGLEPTRAERPTRLPVCARRSIWPWRLIV